MRNRSHLVSFFTALTLILGCSKEPEAPPVPTVTIENLKIAHACAFKRSMWYANAANEADRERLGNLAAMFRAISRSEAIHASNHERLLMSKNATTDTSKAACLPLGSARQALKMAQSLERTEYEGLYPPMVAAAVKESWPEAAEQLRLSGMVDSDHMAFIKEAADRNGTVPLRTYRICSTCGQIATSEAAACNVCASTTLEKL